MIINFTGNWEKFDPGNFILQKHDSWSNQYLKDKGFIFKITEEDQETIPDLLWKNWA
jgi:hypothetical protein